MGASLDERALLIAVETAQAVAQRTAPNAATAAMEVMCAYLIADAQLQIAKKQRDPIKDPCGELADRLLAAAGFEMPSADAMRAMGLLGLQPLLRMKQSMPTGVLVPLDVPRRGGWRKAVSDWLLRTPK